MTPEQQMRADLYRAAFARLGRWPSYDPNLRHQSAAERQARKAAMDAVRARYA